MSIKNQAVAKAQKLRTIHAPSVCLEQELVPEEQSISGHPSTGSQELGEIFGVSYGLWEMSTGTMQDIEVEELFVVLSGSATVQIHERNGFAATTLALEPGTVCQLSEGMHTTWVVDAPLRKMYLAKAE